MGAEVKQSLSSLKADSAPGPQQKPALFPLVRADRCAVKVGKAKKSVCDCLNFLRIHLNRARLNDESQELCLDHMEFTL